MQKKIHEEQIEMKEKEIRAVEERELKLHEQIEHMQQEYDKLDKAHVMLKAAEFDKVDVLKQNAEIEGRNKNIKIDLDNVTRERDMQRQSLDAKTEECAKLKEQVRVISTELEYYRKSHELQMDKFDQKFADFQNELNDLSDQNLVLRDKEKRSKKKINELEVENLEWKERAKYLQTRNNELTNQVGSVEKDLIRMTRD